MIHEFRTYDLSPGSLPQYYQNTEPMMEKRLEYSPLVGYFHTEVGPLNRVLHIWEYKDLNERTDDIQLVLFQRYMRLGNPR